MWRRLTSLYQTAFLSLFTSGRLIEYIFWVKMNLYAWTRMFGWANFFRPFKLEIFAHLKTWLTPIKRLALLKERLIMGYLSHLRYYLPPVRLVMALILLRSSMKTRTAVNRLLIQLNILLRTLLLLVSMTFETNFKSCERLIDRQNWAFQTLFWSWWQSGL